MVEEEKDYRDTNSIPVQWSSKLNAAKVSGLKKLFGKNVDAEAVEVLQDEICTNIKNKREEIRRSWALKFYNTFENTINEKLKKIEALKSILVQVSNNNRRKLLAEQNEASSKSKFQISLHKADVMKASNYVIDDVVKTTFGASLKKGVEPWLDMSQKTVENKLWDFANETPRVKEAVNTNIDNILKQMPKDEVKRILDHLQVLAAPLWNYNTQGFNNTNKELDRFVIVGVGNRDTSVLSQNDVYKTFFAVSSRNTQFASTNQYDRVYVLVVEDLLPIYAVNCFSTYQRDSEEKVAKGFMMANYLDEKLNNRINSENFMVLPTIPSDNVLQYWVWGFVFDYIHYDATDKQYWIRSKSRGDALRKYRFNLGSQRDVAFDIFQSEGLNKEVEAALNGMIAKNGSQPIEDKIAQIKQDDSYLESYAQLSPLEKSNINEPNFKAVRDLLVQEVSLMSD